MAMYGDAQTWEVLTMKNCIEPPYICLEEEFYVVTSSKVELQLIATTTFMRINFHYFFSFWVCLYKLRDLYR